MDMQDLVKLACDVRSNYAVILLKFREADDHDALEVRREYRQ